MRALLRAVAVLTLLVACSPDQGITSSPSSTSSASAPASMSPSWSADVTTDASSPTTAPDARGTASPARVPPSTPVPTLSPEERDLVSSFRADAAFNCTPRRTDLPPAALVGVECRPDSDVIARVGFYRFATAEAATLAYLARIASAGVALNSGECNDGQPADYGSQREGDPTLTFQGLTLSLQREGCFWDQNGTANFRATCSSGARYVGVLGRQSDMASVAEWASLPDDTGGTDPGICFSGDGVGGL